MIANNRTSLGLSRCATQQTLQNCNSVQQNRKNASPQGRATGTRLLEEQKPIQKEEEKVQN
uniref:Transcription factor BTF3 homolog 4-like n=1 Tax=Rhizophora mucronata TaxID=61149 RepID=A0A2P2K0L9_RHIMU